MGNSSGSEMTPQEDHLMVADPKALQYIIHTPGYNFPKRRDMVKVTEMVVGKALTCSHGAISFFTRNSRSCAISQQCRSRESP
jgi:hypothetical protein